MQTERINYLFNQWLQDALSPEEREVFFDLLRDPSNGKSITEILQELMERQPDGPQWNGLRLNEMVHVVLSADKRQHPNVAPPMARIVRLRRLVAAAAILIFISLSTYFYFHNASKQDIAAISVQERFKNDLSPGRNKAILTLSNGARIILDSAANGTLANQGRTRIIKIDSGLLAYNASAVPVGQIQTWNTLSTPRGGQYKLVLPDGSKVWLNAASSIKYPTAFAGKERLVEITGEAYVEVVYHAKMPFRVRAGNAILEDLGTQFNINAYPDEPAMKTTVLEGSVKISSDADSHILHPGEQAQLMGSGRQAIKTIEGVDTAAVVAWKNGLFQMDHADIGMIMRQLARWYDVEVVYEGQVNKVFRGALPRDMSAAHLFRALELTGGVHFAIDGKKVTVMP